MTISTASILQGVTDISTPAMERIGELLEYLVNERCMPWCGEGSRRHAKIVKEKECSDKIITLREAINEELSNFSEGSCDPSKNISRLQENINYQYGNLLLNSDSARYRASHFCIVSSLVGFDIRLQKGKVKQVKE